MNLNASQAQDEKERCAHESFYSENDEGNGDLMIKIKRWKH